MDGLMWEWSVGESRVVIDLVKKVAGHVAHGAWFFRIVG